MTFVDKLNFDTPRDDLVNLPGKAYLHSSGQGIYGSKEEMKKSIYSSLFKSPFLNDNFDFFNAILWSENNVKIMDFFGYSGLEDNWNANPEVSSWVVRNGVWGREKNFTCGDGIILLGEEEKFRRKTKDLNEYLSQTLNLKELNKKFKFS